MRRRGSDSERKLRRLPQPQARKGGAAPEPAEDLSRVADPEPEEEQEPDPPLCPKCLEAAAESGTPLVAK